MRGYFHNYWDSEASSLSRQILVSLPRVASTLSDKRPTSDIDSYMDILDCFSVGVVLTLNCHSYRNQICNRELKWPFNMRTAAGYAKKGTWNNNENRVTRVSYHASWQVPIIAKTPNFTDTPECRQTELGKYNRLQAQKRHRKSMMWVNCCLVHLNTMRCESLYSVIQIWRSMMQKI